MPRRRRSWSDDEVVIELAEDSGSEAGADSDFQSMSGECADYFYNYFFLTISLEKNYYFWSQISIVKMFQNSIISGL